MTDVPAPDILVPVFHSLTGMIIWLIATVLMPIVVGLLTKWQTSSAVKALLLVALSLANGLFSEWLAAGDGYDWRKALMQAVVSFVIAGAAYARVWRPTGASAVALNVGSRVKYENHAEAGRASLTPDIQSPGQHRYDPYRPDGV